MRFWMIGDWKNTMSIHTRTHTRPYVCEYKQLNYVHTDGPYKFAHTKILKKTARSVSVWTHETREYTRAQG